MLRLPPKWIIIQVFILSTFQNQHLLLVPHLLHLVYLTITFLLRCDSRQSTNKSLLAIRKTKPARDFAAALQISFENSISLLSFHFLCQCWQYLTRCPEFGSTNKYLRSNLAGLFAIPGSRRSRWFVLPIMRMPSFSERPPTGMRRNERTSSVTKESRSSTTQ